MYINLFYSFGFVYYSNVDEAEEVFDSPDNITVDGRALFIDFVTPKLPDGKCGGTVCSTAHSLLLVFSCTVLYRELVPFIWTKCNHRQVIFYCYNNNYYYYYRR